MISLQSQLFQKHHEPIVFRGTRFAQERQSFTLRKVKRRWRKLTSNVYEGRKQFAYYFFPAKSSFPYESLIKLAVHYTIALFFKSK
jgi:hypothetical protein